MLGARGLEFQLSLIRYLTLARPSGDLLSPSVCNIDLNARPIHAKF